MRKEGLEGQVHFRTVCKFCPFSESPNLWQHTECPEKVCGRTCFYLVSPTANCPLIFFQISHISRERLGKCHSTQKPHHMKAKSFFREPRWNSACLRPVCSHFHSVWNFQLSPEALGIILALAFAHYTWLVLSGSGNLGWLLFVKSNKRLSNDHSATTKRVQGIGTVRSRY